MRSWSSRKMSQLGGGEKNSILGTYLSTIELLRLQLFGERKRKREKHTYKYATQCTLIEDRRKTDKIRRYPQSENS